MPDSTAPAEQSRREARNREEWAFRKRILRGLLVAALTAIILFLLVEYDLLAGRIMAESRNLNSEGQPTIKVREFRSFLDDNPPYRFEYYCYSYREIWSCQSFVGRSYVANTAKIEWSPDGTATVFLDDDPKFTCKGGVWKNAVQK